VDSQRARHIVALGGGGFSYQDSSPALGDYILRLAGKPRPKICYIPTAGRDSEIARLEFFRCVGDRARVSELILFQRTVRDPRGFLLDQDVIYVGGGNTANMLAIWRVHGIDKILREAWEVGIVLAGVSAGGICWFEAGVTDSFGPELAPLEGGLGFLAGSFCPHYNSEAARQPTYHRLVATGFPPGYAADDWVGLHFAGTDLAEVISITETGRAYRVQSRDGEVVEEPIVPRLLR
jgi:peptidase E